MDDGIIKLEQLKKWRSRRKQDVQIDQTMNAFCRSLRKVNKQVVQLQDAWIEFVPHQLATLSMPVSFKQGVLVVAVDGAPTAYQVNRLVRGGLLRKLQTRCSGTLKQVKVKVHS